MFSGPVEVDESYMRREEAKEACEQDAQRGGEGVVGKTVVEGMKERETNEIRAEVVSATKRTTLQVFLMEHAAPDAVVYTEGVAAYRGIARTHGTARYSVGEYTCDQAHTNGLASLWALMKRGYVDIYRKTSPRHLGQCVKKLQCCHNVREKDILERMEAIMTGMSLKRLLYREWIADNGLPCGARS